MNQIKTGRFIALLRKEKNMTQEELAQKLSVSAKSISRWETGRTMPDWSVLQELCSQLGITVNEFFNGDRIPDSILKEKTEDMLVETINSEHKKRKKSIGILLTVIILLSLIFSTVSVMFAIDANRMTNGKPVVFSTWGFYYWPPADLSEEYMTTAIKNYFSFEREHHPYTDGSDPRTFVSLKLLGKEDRGDTVTVYAWVVDATWYINSDGVPEEGSASSVPYRLTLSKTEDGYRVTACDQPRDGGLYVDSIKELFPVRVRKKVENVQFDGTVEKLLYDIQTQVDLYYRR